MKPLRADRPVVASLSLRLGLAALAAALLSLSAPAETLGQTTDTRLRLDRAIAEPAYFPGKTRVRLYATAVTLQGGFIPITGKKAFGLKVNGSRKNFPYLIGAFAGTQEPLAIAIVIQTGFEYAANFDEIKAAFAPLLESLPKDAQISVVTYSDTVSATGFLTPTRAARKIADLSADSAPSDTVLIKAVERATRLLDRATRAKGATGDNNVPARKFIVVLSDGKDIDPDPKRYRKAGERAAKKRVRIHSVAFSPEDNRRPLVGLGELSKRSFGTFRWVRGGGLFGAQFASLAAEVAKQYVLTFFVDAKAIDGKRIAIVAGDAESNELRVKVACGQDTCGGDQYCAQGRCVTRSEAGGGGVLLWIVYIGGGLLASLLTLAFIGYLLSKRTAVPHPGQPQAISPGAVGQPAAPAPGGEARGRIVAYDAQGNALGAGAPSPSAAPSHAAVRSSVYVVSGVGAGRSIPITHGATVGTHPGCQIPIVGDGYASSIHAQFLIDTSGNCSIVDKGSTNGTFVNGVRTQHHALVHGNTIKIGGVELRFLRN